MNESSTPETVDRRKALSSLLGVSTAALAGTALAPAGAAAASYPRRKHGSLVLDVATRFSTFRVCVPDGSDEPSPLGVPRGASFLLEGGIFPGGFIEPGALFDVDKYLDHRIGHWFCWGNLIATNQRPDPHVLSTQEYVLGSIDIDRPFPPDKLLSGGMEGTFEAANTAQMRAVIGGSGRHAGASGHLAQFLIGQNTDRDSDGLNSSTLRFSFDVRTRRHASVRQLTRRAGLRS